MKPKTAATPSSEAFLAFAVDQLSAVPEVSARRMFGGHGLYAGAVFFGIVHDGRLYFYTTELTRRDYLAAGMEVFTPNAKQRLTRYYEVPANILENAPLLCEWAGRAIAGRARA